MKSRICIGGRARRFQYLLRRGMVPHGCERRNRLSTHVTRVKYGSRPGRLGCLDRVDIVQRSRPHYYWR